MVIFLELVPLENHIVSLGVFKSTNLKRPILFRDPEKKKACECNDLELESTFDIQDCVKRFINKYQNIFKCDPVILTLYDYTKKLVTSILKSHSIFFVEKNFVDSPIDTSSYPWHCESCESAQYNSCIEIKEEFKTQLLQLRELLQFLESRDLDEIDFYLAWLTTAYSSQ